MSAGKLVVGFAPALLWLVASSGCTGDPAGSAPADTGNDSAVGGQAGSVDMVAEVASAGAGLGGAVDDANDFAYPTGAVARQYERVVANGSTLLRIINVALAPAARPADTATETGMAGAAGMPGETPVPVDPKVSRAFDVYVDGDVGVAFTSNGVFDCAAAPPEVSVASGRARFVLRPAGAKATAPALVVSDVVDLDPDARLTLLVTGDAGVPQLTILGKDAAEVPSGSRAIWFVNGTSSGQMRVYFPPNEAPTLVMPGVAAPHSVPIPASSDPKFIQFDLALAASLVPPAFTLPPEIASGSHSLAVATPETLYLFPDEKPAACLARNPEVVVTNASLWYTRIVAFGPAGSKFTPFAPVQVRGDGVGSTFDVRIGGLEQATSQIASLPVSDKGVELLFRSKVLGSDLASFTTPPLEAGKRYFLVFYDTVTPFGGKDEMGRPDLSLPDTPEFGLYQVPFDWTVPSPDADCAGFILNLGQGMPEEGLDLAARFVDYADTATAKPTTFHSDYVKIHLPASPSLTPFDFGAVDTTGAASGLPSVVPYGHTSIPLGPNGLPTDEWWSTLSQFDSTLGTGYLSCGLNVTRGQYWPTNPTVSSLDWSFKLQKPDRAAPLLP